MPPKPRVDPSDPFAGVEVGEQEERVSGANRERGKFYGVGDDYAAVRPARPHSRPANPRQADGIAERVTTPRYQTASDDDRRLLMNLGPEAVRQVQMALSEVGLIKPNSAYRVGVVDNTTRNAFADLLGYANQEGLDWKTALVKYAGEGGMEGDGDAVGSGGVGGGGGAVEPGDVNRATNQLTIEQQMQQVARERLGRKLNAKEVSKFVSLYRGMERGYNAEMNAAEDIVEAGGDATIEEQAPVGAAADQFIDSNYANEAGGQDAYGYLGALKNLLGG